MPPKINKAISELQSSIRDLGPTTFLDGSSYNAPCDYQRYGFMVVSHFINLDIIQTADLPAMKKNFVRSPKLKNVFNNIARPKEGATGLTYNMVKGWSAPVIERVHGLLTLAFSGPTPTWLQWGWLCPKPKDPDNGITLDSLRPLMLLEVLRKIWVWIHVRKIVPLGEASGPHAQPTWLSQGSRHGFRAHRPPQLPRTRSAYKHPTFPFQLGHPQGFRLGLQGGDGRQLATTGCPSGHGSLDSTPG